MKRQNTIYIQRSIQSVALYKPHIQDFEIELFRAKTICCSFSLQNVAIASLMQGHTDTNRLCNYFFLSFAHSELHQTILLFIPSHIVCFLLEDRNTIRRYFSLKCRHPNVQKLFSFCARCMASSYGNIDR